MGRLCISMRPIQDSRVSCDEGAWKAVCACGSPRVFTTKAAALRMLSKGSCRDCTTDYRNVQGPQVGIWKNAQGKWCSKCSGCGAEQAYTRKDHAKQSHVSDWQCRACVGKARKFSENRHVGDKNRTFNKFRKSALSRGIPWELTEEQMFAPYSGQCALTGWAISLDYTSPTASLDRIDSSKGYTVDNIQWVHSVVNMSKNKYPQDLFIEMCKAVSRAVQITTTTRKIIYDDPN